MVVLLWSSLSGLSTRSLQSTLFGNGGASVIEGDSGCSKGCGGGGCGIVCARDRTRQQ